MPIRRVPNSIRLFFRYLRGSNRQTRFVNEVRNAATLEELEDVLHGYAWTYVAFMLPRITLARKEEIVEIMISNLKKYLRTTGELRITVENAIDAQYPPV